MALNRFLCVIVFAISLNGCGRKGNVVVAPPAANDPTPASTNSNQVSYVAMPVPEVGADTKYDMAVGEAMTLLAEGKLTEALTALEKAKTVRDTDLVRSEIDTLKQRLETTTTAQKTAADIRIVLQQGRADEAARLAGRALDQFGGGALGTTFAALKQQADAMLLTSADQNAQAEKFRQEAELAARSKNYRAALVAYQQALAIQPNDEWKRHADQVQSIVTRYDDLTHRAAEVRRDPYQLEEAISLYQQAGQLWDTLQVRNDIDACQLALQNRRERIAIADFEQRGEVGIPHAGRVVAEELIRPFRTRFDVVERQQFEKLLGEANLQFTDLNESVGPQRELGRLAKVRYLVVGSITPTFGGIAVHARMIEVDSGLVVQTAKLVVANAQQMTQQAPQLAQVLMMSDMEKMAYEQGLARNVNIPVIEPGVIAPPPPPSPANVPPPPPIIPFLPRCPDVGQLGVDDFDRLPPVVVGPAPPTAGISFTIDKDYKARPRLTQLAIELGDNLFRRGQYQDALAQFQLAFSLNPGQTNIQARIDQCRPHVPVPLPPLRRPRLVVLDFVHPGHSGALTPGMGAWVADQLAPYFSPTYAVMDRGAMYWYMARLGMSLRDVVLDPMARAYLGQALNTRYFIVGTMRTTPAGLEVTAHLLDAATNIRLDMARITARNAAELKMRIPELAQWIQMDPAERIARQQHAAAYQQFLDQAEQCNHRHEYPQAIGFYQQALKFRPNDVTVLALLSQTEHRARNWELQNRRSADWKSGQTQRTTFKTQQAELLREAEAARVAAEKQAAAVAAVEKERQKRAAYDKLVSQARSARDKQQWAQAAQLYESAMGLDRSPDVVREFDGVKSRMDEINRTKAAEDRAAKEAKLRQEREMEIARLKKQAEEDKRRRADEEAKRKRQQEDRDRAQYTRLFDNATSLMNNKRWDEAISVLLQARQLKATPEVEEKLAAAYKAKSAASADAKKMAEEKAKKEAEAKAKITPPVVVVPPPIPTPKTQPKVVTPPPLPKEKPKATMPPPVPKEKPKAEVPPPLPKEKPKVEVPPPLPKEKPKATTPPPLPKEKAKVETPPPLTKETPKAVAPPPPLPKEKPKAVTPPPLPKDKAKPKVETPPPLPKQPEKPKGPPAEFMKKMEAGVAAERQGRFGEAQQAYQDALKFVPNDPTALRRGEYAKHMDIGMKALNAKKSVEAVRAFEAALKVMPGDRVAQQQLQRARSVK